MAQREAAAAEDTVLVRVVEETESLYRVPVSRLEALRLPSSREEVEAEPYVDDEMLWAAVEGLSPEEYSVRERTSTLEKEE